MLYINKDSYIGSVNLGHKVKGKMVYANNEIYDGEWSNDKQHGKGTMTYPDGREFIIANWINGYVAYDIKFTDKEGNQYNGSASSIEGAGIHTKNGTGTMVYKNGNEYRGQW